MASLIDNKAVQAEFAALFVSGYTRAQLASHFGVGADTVSRWAKDERVEAIITRLIREREKSILRLVDGELLNRIQTRADQMDVDDLIKIRRTFAPGGVTDKQEADEDADMAAWEALDRGDTLPELPEHTGDDWDVPEWEGPITDAEVVDD